MDQGNMVPGDTAPKGGTKDPKDHKVPKDDTMDPKARISKDGTKGPKDHTMAIPSSMRDPRPPMERN